MKLDLEFWDFVGVDPGLAHCGLALLEGNELLETRLLTTVKEDGDEAQRIQDLATAFYLFVDGLGERVSGDNTILAIESLHFQQVRHAGEPSERDFRAEAGKAARTIRTAQVAGAIMAVAARFGLEVIEVAPSRAKRAVTGEQKASKQQVQRMVEAMYGTDGLSEHEADAVAVATAARDILKERRLGLER